MITLTNFFTSKKRKYLRINLFISMKSFLCFHLYTLFAPYKLLKQGEEVRRERNKHKIAYTESCWFFNIHKKIFKKGEIIKWVI